MKDKQVEQTIFTEEDLNSCWDPRYHVTYFLNLLNRETSVETAREDLFSLIGTKYDTRQNIPTFTRTSIRDSSENNIYCINKDEIKGE